MTIPEAIDILTLKTKGRDIMPKIMEIEAQKLGIEALKRFTSMRKDPNCRGFWPLPGETP